MIGSLEHKMEPRTKLILAGVGGFAFYCFILIFLVTVNWITIWTAIIAIFGVILLLALPFSIWYIFKLKAQKTEENIFNKKRQLDSAGAEQFAVDFFKNKYHDDISIEENLTIQIGKFGERTPIYCLKLFGTTSHDVYFFLINGLDSQLYTHGKGLLSDDKKQYFAENLSLAKDVTPKRRKIIESIDGSRIQEEEDLNPPDVEEEIKEEKKEVKR